MSRHNLFEVNFQAVLKRVKNIVYFFIFCYTMPLFKKAHTRKHKQWVSGKKLLKNKSVECLGFFLHALSKYCLKWVQKILYQNFRDTKRQNSDEPKTFKMP